MQTWMAHLWVALWHRTAELSTTLDLNALDYSACSMYCSCGQDLGGPAQVESARASSQQGAHVRSYSRSQILVPQ